MTAVISFEPPLKSIIPHETVAVCEFEKFAAPNRSNLSMSAEAESLGVHIEP